MNLPQSIAEFWNEPYARAGVLLLAAIIGGFVADQLCTRILFRLARRSKTEVDDKVIRALHRPIFVSVVLIGLAWTAATLSFSDRQLFFVHAALKSIAIIVWSIGGFKIISLVLQWLGSRANDQGLLQVQTLPLFENLGKIFLFGGATYALLVSWNVNVAAWLASAGIVGIAVGFAAKDTLANLFSGVFIMADAPYKIGDYIVLDSGERGKVTMIGLRSTRILTRDDVEVTLPNAAIASAMITNESGGRHLKYRVRVTVSVAYGSDIDRVRELLLETVPGVEGISSYPEARVRFREFGDSGLIFQLMCWVEEPELRGRVLDKLNTRVYKRLREEGVEIPYPKRDVYVREGPGGDAISPLK